MLAEILNYQGTSPILGMGSLSNTYDTVFEVEGKFLDTDGKNISELSDIKRDIIEKQVKKYFIAKTQSTKD